MTPAARISAAIALMDRILAGELADRALASWGRQNRYAGSKDRAAIADLVYDVLRRKRSLSAIGGGDDGRALLLGHVKDAGLAPETVFGAGPYAPAALTDAELSAGRLPDGGNGESADFPAWLWPDIRDALGDQADDIVAQMQRRAPVHLRVNLAKRSRSSAIEMLSLDGITAQPHALSPAALQVSEGARKIKTSQAYLTGTVELQDAASQAVADMVPLAEGQTLLDFCAGGGGKTLAVAGRVTGTFFAHDVDAKRMKDLPARAARADVSVGLLSLSQVQQSAPFDSVLIDAPCSGSGSWRRDPQGKWLLTPDRLKAILDVQRAILDQCAAFIGPHGHLVYATCSLLSCENTQQVDGFLSRNTAFSRVEHRNFTPLEGGDGFYGAVLRRN